MDPAGGTSAPNSTNLNTDSAAGVKAPEGMDLSAINEAIAASADEAANAPQQTFDVNDISLDNTPTTDAGLAAQQAKDPSMNLANSEAAPSAPAAPAPVAAPSTPTELPETPAAAPAAPATEEKPAAAEAAFVDGDIVDEAPAAAAEEEAKAPEPNYDALNADPLASFESTAAAEAPAEGAAPAEGEAKKDGDAKDGEEKKGMKKDIKIHIDFNAILHSNFAIIGIVVAVIIILVAVVLIVTLNG